MRESKAQRFGPYVILDRIGDGGMAEIFLAKIRGYSGFEKLVALKRIHSRYSQNQTFARMLVHEAKLAAALRHFNVVQVYDLGEIDGQVFIAMEYVQGRDLANVLSNTYRRKERLPLNVGLCVATEFMTGLDYAHRMRATDGTPLGIIHRDISPQNILISFEGEVKVTDFGIARVLSEKDNIDLPGNLHGKFGYMSPEQVKGQEIDQRSDIFSAGVVLWEILTGRRLFRGKEHRETIRMIVSHPVAPPSTRNAEIPPEVDRIVLKALARDRGERYQTTGALLGELSRAADNLPRRAASRDLSVYMRRHFGSQLGTMTPRPRLVMKPSSAGRAPTAAIDAPREDGTNGPGQAHNPLGHILLTHGALTDQELEVALAEQRARGGRIGELLIESGTVSEKDLTRAVATQANRPVIEPEDLLALPPPERLLERFPREAAEATLILPISINEEQRSVGLAVVDPFDDRAILETKVVLGVNDVTLFITPQSGIREAIRRWYEDESEPRAAPPVEPIFVEGAAPPATAPLVLLADADLETLQPLARQIRAENCEVLLVSNGKHAREIVRERRPSIAFLDASLPGIDGYNILLEVRSRNEDAAIFITSSRGDEFRQAKALELGADDFIVKPLSLEVTASRIRREIKKRQGRKPVVGQPVAFAGVSGSLEDMTALDVVQSLELGRKQAHVVLQYEDGRSGTLNVRGGIVRGAVLGDHTGEEAFYALMQPGRGLFRIEYGGSSTPENITRPNAYLMIEMSRRLDHSDGARHRARRRVHRAPNSHPPTKGDLAGSQDLTADLVLESGRPPQKQSPRVPSTRDPPCDK